MRFIITAIAFLLTINLWGQEGGALTSQEKSEISAHLQQSWNHLENVISNLSLAQWHYKPSDTVWSIAEISEHLEKSENELFGLVSNQLAKTAPHPEKVGEVSGRTEAMMKAVTSRDQKVKTRPELEPSGQYQTPSAFIEKFKNLRSASIDYANTTEDKLRYHFVPFGPLGELDGYQILMFMSGHLERHIQQIEEVMNDPNYPST